MSKKNKTSLRKRSVSSKKDNVQKRINQISEAYAKRDISELRKLATTGPGLVNDGLRRLCWPLLLHCKPDDEKDFQDEHSDEHQVLLDVNRSFVYFPQGLNHAKRKKKQSELNDVIVGILRRHPKLAYYQGFHDICSVLLLVLGNKVDAIKAGENIAMFLLRDAMLEDSLALILKQLDLLNVLIRLEDPEIADLLENALPYFCLSWVITWCSHDVRDFSKVVRLFDFFIASDPLIAIYLSARVVISRRKELLALECDSETIGLFLSKFPQYIDIDELISKTIQLYNKHPPGVLQRAANEVLDETSCSSLYDQHWLRLKVDEPIDYSIADEILSLPPSAREPKSPKKSNKINEKQTLVVILVTAAAALVAYQLLPY